MSDIPGLSDEDLRALEGDGVAFTPQNAVQEIPPAVVAHAAARAAGTVHPVPEPLLFQVLLHLFGGPAYVVRVGGHDFSTVHSKLSLEDLCAPMPASDTAFRAAAATFLKQHRDALRILRGGALDGYPRVAALQEALVNGLLRPVDLTADPLESGSETVVRTRVAIVVNEVLHQKNERVLQYMGTPTAEAATRYQDAVFRRKSRTPESSALDDSVAWYEAYRPEQLRRAIEAFNG